MDVSDKSVFLILTAILVTTSNIKSPTSLNILNLKVKALNKVKGKTRKVIQKFDFSKQMFHATEKK